MREKSKNTIYSVTFHATLHIAQIIILDTRLFHKNVEKSFFGEKCQKVGQKGLQVGSRG